MSFCFLIFISNLRDIWLTGASLLEEPNSGPMNYKYATMIIDVNIHHSCDGGKIQNRSFDGQL